MDKFTILVTGDRHWTNRTLVQSVLAEYPAPARLIHGACSGADTIAAEIGKELGFDVVGYPADWRRWGDAAGPMRNGEMLQLERPDLVIAFHNNLWGKSRGTRDMVEKAKDAGVAVRLVREEKLHDISAK